MTKELTPPNLKQCQAEKPGRGPFTMGGRIGDPNNGYRVRCEDKPIVIATETIAGADGKRGQMSLCESCKDALIKQEGGGICTFENIEKSLICPQCGGTETYRMDGMAEKPIKVEIHGLVCTKCSILMFDGFSHYLAPLKVGDMLYGYCEGWFGDSHEDKCIEGVGEDWIACRDPDGNVHMAARLSVDEVLNKPENRQKKEE